MNIIKNKWVRLAVFVIATALVCGCTLSFVNVSIRYTEFQNSLRDYRSYYTEEAERLYTDLWAFSNIYIKNLDKKGSLIEYSYKTPYIKAAMKEVGFEVDHNVVSMRHSDFFDYSVTYKGFNLYSNTNEEISTDDINTLVAVNGSDIIKQPMYLNGIYPGSWYYTNGMGFEYYYLEYYNKGFAVYDYDTTGLESYVDELGAVIYLNEDGTSPIPTKFRDENEQFVVAKDYVPFFEGDQSGCQITMRIKPYLIAKLDSNNIEQEFTDKVVSLIPFAAIIAVLTIYLIFTAGYDSKEQKYRISGFDKIYTEIHLIVTIFAIIAACALIGTNIIRELNRILSPDIFYISIRAMFVFGIGGAYIITVLSLSSIILRIRCKKLMDTTVILIILRAVFRGAKKCIHNAAKAIKTANKESQLQKDNHYLRRFYIRCAVFGAAALILAIFSMAIYSIPFMLLSFIVLASGFIFLCVRDLRELTPLSQHIRRISDGDYSVYDGNESIATYGMHTHLNNISDGMEAAVEKQLKSERMKIDLVTNVSHDLKTPLTSIIGYIDLLSKEELSPEARDYVAILESKAAKLKSMVSDVFDLAKATSGTDVTLEKIDAVILIGQVLGDLEDKISGKEIRKIISAETAPVMADGKKLYRVMQNLIDNALQYSLEGTRIYISLNTDENNAVIKVQNISSYEMNFTADEITERFVRGDQSRTSEGNGLGLSIAKSYTEAAGGSFRVEINGDSFTAVVSLPLTNE